MKAKYGVVLNGNVDVELSKYDIDIWIAVDGGIKFLNNENIIADYYLGDMDSSSNYKNYKNIIKYDPIKDQTDFLLSLDIIKEDETLIFGFFKNIRLEHFYANLKLIKSNMTYVYNEGIIKLYTKGDYEIFNNGIYDYVSFFSNKESALITITNASYEVDNYLLMQKDIVGISNEFNNDKAVNLCVKSGEILTFLSTKD